MSRSAAPTHVVIPTIQGDSSAAVTLQHVNRIIENMAFLDQESGKAMAAIQEVRDLIVTNTQEIGVNIGRMLDGKLAEMRAKVETLLNDVSTTTAFQELEGRMRAVEALLREVVHTDRGGGERPGTSKLWTPASQRWVYSEPTVPTGGASFTT